MRHPARRSRPDVRSLAAGVAVLLAAPAARAQYTYTILTAPGAPFTEAYGINAAGEIVGRYDDGTGLHGFIATTTPEPRTWALLGAGLVALDAAARRRATV